MKNLNPAVSALILGIISNILNCIMTIVALWSGGFVFGGIFIILPIAGIANSATALKAGISRPLAIVSLILNIIGTIVAGIFVLVGIIGKVAGLFS